ncbi:MAG: SprB repeat-containing protein, partial [Bacteroidales bacterium]|nr:SprB repeat-containing protein [Bacteroidales bacterium]
RDTAICPGDTVALFATGTRVDSLFWTPQTYVVAGLGAKSETDTVWVSPAVSTTYTVTLVSIEGCTTPRNVRVNIHPSTSTTAAASDVYACLNGSTRIATTTRGYDLSYIWQRRVGGVGEWKLASDKAPAGKYEGLNSPNLTVNYVEKIEEGDQYRLIAVSSRCMPSDTTAPVTLHVLDSIIFSISLVDTPRCVNEPARIKLYTNVSASALKAFSVELNGGTAGKRTFQTRDTLFTIPNITPGEKVQAFMTPTGLIASCVDVLPIPSEIIDLGVQPAPTLSYTYNNPTTCGGEDGSITLSGNKGTAPYTYTFNSVDKGSQTLYSGLNAGMYSAQVADIYSCKSEPVYISLRDPNGPVAPAVTNAGVYCVQDTLPEYLLLDPNTKKAEIRWFTDMMCTNQVHTGDSMAFPSVPGVYTYYLYQIKNNCKSATVRVWVFVGGAPEFTSIEAIVPSSCGESDGIISIYAKG